MEFKRFHPFRETESVRNRNADIFLSANDFIMPYFVIAGNNRKEPVSSLKGVYRFSADLLMDEIHQLVALEIDKILLFGVVEEEQKSAHGDYSFSLESPVINAIHQIKKHFPKITVITDVCLCAYTSHGHCGVLNTDGNVDNDITLTYLSRMAVAHARAGADIVAPSAMMDGQVLAIRLLLDEEGHSSVKIMGYSAKYASAFYGPFRDAAQSAPGHGDRKRYQMDYRTLLQGVDEVTADIDEGADYVMVKPAHSYLDVLARVRDRFPDVRLAAYHTSGEYMMIVAAAEKGLLDEYQAMIEALTAIKRAGADYIISYYAKEYATRTE